MVDAVTSATSTAQAQSGGVGSGTAISSDFETFLKMLTAQINNQDPLNPLDSTDFASQLATFSGVEQQVLTNDLLSGLTSQLSASGMAEMAGWVGMEARAVAPVFFDGSTPVAFTSAPLAGADRADLVVRNTDGVELQRFDVPLGVETLEWTGIGVGGAPLAPGEYSLELTSYAGEEELRTEPVEVYQAVREVRQGRNGIVLLLASGAEISADAVTALRDPV